MMKKAKNFVRDRGLGAKGEELLISILTKSGFIATKNTTKSDMLYWDIRAKHEKGEVTFEVKYDLYSARSGNIAIEYYNPKSAKPSGLNATKANFWVQVLPDETAWLAPLETLRKFCAETKPFKNIVAGGDDNSSMFIYQKDLILPAVFVKINESNISDTIWSRHEGILSINNRSN